MNFENKTVIVTGGSRGIGKAISIKLATMGAKIAIVSSSEQGKEVELEINKLTSGSKSYVSDISNTQKNIDLIKEISEDFGQIDVLVNNAGITIDGLSIRMSDDDFDKVINLNLKGAFTLSREVSKLMIKSGGGSIINMSSVIALHGNIGQANYAAAKAGMIGLTKSFAKELARRNIRVNAIAPGFIDTAMTEAINDLAKETVLNQIPMKRFGTAEEVADLTVYLASDASSYITGQVFVIDGGLFI